MSTLLEHEATETFFVFYIIGFFEFKEISFEDDLRRPRTLHHNNEIILGEVTEDGRALRPAPVESPTTISLEGFFEFLVQV